MDGETLTESQGFPGGVSNGEGINHVFITSATSRVVGRLG